MRRLLAAALTAATVAGILPLQALAGTSQTITWTSVAPANAAVGGAPYMPTATATSGLPVVFTIDPASAGACSISAGEVTFQHVGTCTVDANQSGDSAWDPAPQDPQAFAVAQGTQTVSITSSAPASPVVGGTYPVTASATSGLTPSITIDTSAAAVCSVAGALVTFDHVGTCVVDANQSGDTDWAAAAQNQQSIVVGQAAQSISFTSTPSSPTVGGPTYSVGATGGNSGNSVTFAIDAASVAYCSIAGTTVSFEHVGTCVIDADQAGNTDYLDAPQKQQTFAIGKGSQTITFTSTAPTAAVVGGTPYAPAATGGATGNPVTFSIAPATAAHCSISGGNVSMDHAGACTVDADQAGNADYNAGSNSQSFSIGLATQTLSFTTVAPAATVDGATYTPAATSTAGLTVSLSVDAGSAGVCTMTAGVVSFQHAGTCVIDANQPGNADYGAATQVQQNVTVGPAEQTITFTSTAPSDAKVGGSTYTVTATGGGSNNPILLTIDAASAGACTMAGAVVSFAHAGSCVIDANQAG
ncbi:MAG TPA: hypothetical protein VIR16_05790, partial [Candidatus Limnocylindrales bacterium]